ncbi:MAG: RsmE family RNA methyltransferase [Planctomycetota bacterium]|jgi:16S rRNA (uracil1498-N3)-methyltransferase|nr:RsmE family RNA methyltransferase [Planctomycetota bacterium]MDP7132695.1 RsmE family RNA methyltransferase [Planctomycetota bacterium]
MARPHRFFLDSIPASGNANLSGSEHHHMSRVLRIDPGETVLLFDGKGQQARGRVSKISKTDSIIEVLECEHQTAPAIELHLALALTKGKQTESVIRMSTELGVTSIQPVLTERSVVRPGDANRIAGRSTHCHRSCQTMRQELSASCEG